MEDSVSIEARSGNGGSESVSGSVASGTVASGTDWKPTRRAEDMRGNAATRQRAPRVIAIASGKGGVGKSVIASNLAVSAARGGRRCALVDLDLGCPNLHTLLGSSPGSATLADFVNKRVESLSDALATTTVPNLWLVSGDGSGPDAANPVHAQKQKILRHIRQLDVDEVILDLGAGASFNVLDFFLAADLGLIVVIPEPTSVENTYHFLKAAVFRAMRHAGREPGVREAIDIAFSQRGAHPMGMRELLAGIFAIDESAALKLWTEIERFAPGLITNQAQTADQRKLGQTIVDQCRRHLGAELRHLGALPRDERVLEAVASGTPALRGFPGCSFTRELEVISAELFRTALPGAMRAPEPAPHVHATRAKQAARTAAGAATPRSIEARPTPGSSPAEHAGAAAAAATAGDLLEPGLFLLRRRTELGLDLGDLRLKTRIPRLESIEREDFDRLPPESYTRAFVLQYARLLGVENAESVAASFIARYRAAQAGETVRESVATPAIATRPFAARAAVANDTPEPAAQHPVPAPASGPAPELPSRRQLRRIRRERSLRRHGY